jgi:HAD superfamily hydrolase (TIGR01490 family)
MNVHQPLTVIEQPVVQLAVRPPESRRAGAPIAVWDVDRTLVRGDTLLPFLRCFTGTARLGGIILESLARHDGPDRRSAAKAAALQRVLGGLELGAVDHKARGYVRSDVMHRLRPDYLRRWQWHRAQGHRMVLASASLGVYLDHLGTTLGADEVICTRMETVNGWLTGRLTGPNCRGEQKAERLRAYLAGRSVGTVWVYADGRADEPTRALADVAVRTRPYRRLPDPDRGRR